MLDSRYCANPLEELQSNSTVLFYERKDVNKWNERKLAATEGEVLLCQAFDRPAERDKDSDDSKRILAYAANEMDYRKTGMMPTQLMLKLGSKYMITYNLCVQDGLFNGATGILRKIVTAPRDDTEDVKYNSKLPGDSETKVLRLWIEFSSNVKIGKKMRAHNDHLFRADQVNKNLNWTPIYPETKTIGSKKNAIEIYKIVRTQYYLIESEAITIHQSQSSTFQNYGAQVTDDLERDLTYTACSRAPRLTDLNLFSAIDPVAGDKVKSILPAFVKQWNREPEKYAKLRKEKIAEEHQKNKGIAEMKRLHRLAPMERTIYLLKLGDRPDPDKNFIVIFHKVNSWNSRLMNYIFSDYGFQRASVIVLAQTNNDNTKHDFNEDMKIKIASKYSFTLTNDGHTVILVAISEHCNLAPLQHDTNKNKNSIQIQNTTDEYGLDTCKIKYIDKNKKTVIYSFTVKYWNFHLFKSQTSEQEAFTVFKEMMLNKYYKTLQQYKGKANCISYTHIHSQGSNAQPNQIANAYVKENAKAISKITSTTSVVEEQEGEKRHYTTPQTAFNDKEFTLKCKTNDAAVTMNISDYICFINKNRFKPHVLHLMIN